MKTLLSLVSYGIYAFLFLGLLLHTSVNPLLFGKYSAEYSLALLAAALGFGPSRYWGGLITALLATRTGKFSRNINLLFSLIKNYQLIVNYSRGTGESNVKGLG